MPEHPRHADIQTTTVYTRLTQSDVQKVISELDKNCGGRKQRFASRPPRHLNSGAKTLAISEWWPQRDSNPCFSLGRAVSSVGERVEVRRLGAHGVRVPLIFGGTIAKTVAVGR